MKIRIAVLVCGFVLIFAAARAVAEQVEAGPFSIQVPEGWHVVASPDAGVVAIILKDKGFAMTLQVSGTGGKKALTLARQASKAHNGTAPEKIKGAKIDAYFYTWTTPLDEKALTRIYVNKRKMLTINAAGDPGPNADEANGILKTLTSGDPVIETMLAELKRDGLPLKKP